MATIRLINTTTSLRVDAALESVFLRTIDPAFKAEIENQNRDPYVDVLFVGRDDPDLAPDDMSPRDGIPDTDKLGVYVDHRLPSHHPAIKVCPERIVEACQQWNHKVGGAPLFTERYPVLLCAVIIHELAHALMDGRRCRGALSWSQYIQWMHNNAANDESEEWTNLPVPDADCEQDFKKRIAARQHVCQVKAQSLDHWITANSTILQSLREQQQVVEESLANAIALNQRFAERQSAALRVFIDAQPGPYKAGLRWQGNIAHLLDTASSWRSFKGDDLWIGDRQWVHDMSEQPSQKDGLTRLARRLGTPGEPISSFDFQKGEFVHSEASSQNLNAAIAEGTGEAVRRFVQQDGALTIIRNGGWEQSFRNVLMAALERATHSVGFAEGSRGKVKRMDLLFRDMRGNPIFRVETKSNFSAQPHGEIRRQVEDALGKLGRTKETALYLVHAICDLWYEGQLAGTLSVHNAKVKRGYKKFVAKTKLRAPGWLEKTGLARTPTCEDHLDEGNGRARVRAWAARITKDESLFQVYYLDERGIEKPVKMFPPNKCDKNKKRKKSNPKARRRSTGV